MNTKYSPTFKRAIRAALLLCAFAALSFTTARAETLIHCTGLPGGDHSYRGFYIPHYPGVSLESARLELSGSSADTYRVSLTVRANTYDGPVLGTSTRNIALTGTTTQNLPVTFDYGSLSIAKGSRVCFILTKISGAGSLYYSVADWAGGCEEVIETEGTNPPLSSFRRNGVSLQIIGEDSSVVPPGQSIQAYIDAASPGDVVFVEPGTYTENLLLRSEVSVTGSGYGNTILHGTGSGSVVTAIGVTNSHFTGFTVTGSGASATAAGFGISGGNLLINNNRITGNRTGLRILNQGTDRGNAIIRNNIVESNGDSGNGVVDYGIYCSNSSPLIANNLVIENEGTGIHLGRVDSSGAQVINNTVAGNTDDGIHCQVDADPIIKNNIVTGNNNGLRASSSAVPQTSFNNVWSNTSQNYVSETAGIASAGLGSISGDPLFDLAAQPPFALLEGSPCIDAGDPAPIYFDSDGSRNDMGAFGGPTALLPSLTSPVASGFLFNNIGKIPTSEITQTGVSSGLANVAPSVASALSIYPYKDAPFGGSLWLHGLFGMTDNLVSHYRVYAAPWTSGMPPIASAFQPLDDPLSKVKYTVNSGGTVTATLQEVGPNADGLYLRTDRPNSGYWSHPDLKLIWNTRAVPNGRYDLLCKGYFHFLGFPIEVALPNNQLSRITVHVDNEGVIATIDSVRDKDGNPIPECGIIPLLHNQEELQFEISATHTNGFLRDYTLDAVYGRNHYAGVIASEQYAGFNDSLPPTWVGVSGDILSSTPAHTLATLNPWTTCAYQFRLRAWARTTDGFNHIYHKTFSDHYFLGVGLSLSGGTSCSADLDGDGDVDGQDLVIFSSQFGNTNCAPVVVTP